MKRVAILVNKDFEYKGFIEGLRDIVQVFSGTNGRDAECRFDNLIADIYCIHNLFDKTENSSNSERKFYHLKDLFKSNEFRLEDVNAVLSFSTSESTPMSQGRDGSESRNGNVYVGNRFFLSDQSSNDPTTDSHLEIGSNESNKTEKYLEEPLCNGLYEIINSTSMALKQAHINPNKEPMCIARGDFSCVGVVNVMDYSCYKIADEVAYAQSYNMTHSCPIGIETTHGVVVKALKSTREDMQMQKHIPTMFISPIVDRYLKFDEDVDGKYGKQNFICSYNGGVATGHILKILNVIM